MSMSDTAEYWFNRNKFHMPNNFTHALNVACGHNHNTKDTLFASRVECHACKKIIKEGNAPHIQHGPVPVSEYMSIKERKKHFARVAFNDKHGLCDCGCSWTIRENAKSGVKFLGCINYPACKKTKTIPNENNTTHS